MNTPSVRDIPAILRFLAGQGVSLVHSVRLVTSDQGMTLQQIAARAAIGRTHLYQMLAGSRPVADSARRAFMDTLGVDPWAIQAEYIYRKGNPL